MNTFEAKSQGQQMRPESSKQAPKTSVKGLTNRPEVDRDWELDALHASRIHPNPILLATQQAS